jgi:hypothetical protein
MDTRLHAGGGLGGRFPDGALFAELGSAAQLARLFVVFAFPQFLLQAAPLQELLEATQRRSDWLSILNPHPQRHVFS